MDESILINRIYLGESERQTESNSESIHITDLKRELQKKLNGYLSQDKRKGLTDISVITMDELIEKLVISRWKCCYCKESIKLLYKHNHLKNPVIESNIIRGSETESRIVSTGKNNNHTDRDFKQWTLDRINNNLEHSNKNTVVACLKCNLDRRRKNFHAYTFTKNLSIQKLYI